MNTPACACQHIDRREDRGESEKAEVKINRRVVSLSEKPLYYDNNLTIPNGKKVLIFLKEFFTMIQKTLQHDVKLQSLLDRCIKIMGTWKNT